MKKSFDQLLLKINHILANDKIMFRNMRSLMVLQFAKYIFPLIIMPYFIHVLGIEKYGVLVFAQTISNYFIMITNYGFYLSAPRDISINRNDIKERNRIISSIFIIKFGIMLVCICAVLLLVNFVSKFSENNIIYIIFLIPVFNEVIFPTWFFQGIEEMDKITILDIVGRFISVIIMFIIVKDSTHIVRAAFVQTVGGTISGIGALYLLFSKYEYKVTRVSFTQLKKLIIEGWNLFISQFSTVIFTNINVTLLGLLSTPEAVGLYSTGEKIVRIAASLVSPVSTALFPNISKLFAESHKRGVMKIREVLKMGVLFFVSISGILFVGAELITKIIVGAYIGQIVIVIRILCLLPTFIFINNIYGTQYMINNGRERQFRNIIVGSGLVLIILSYSLIRIIGINGAAIALVISELLLVLLMVNEVELGKEKVKLIGKVN